jgi:hypothetical protein
MLQFAVEVAINRESRRMFTNISSGFPIPLQGMKSARIERAAANSTFVSEFNFHACLYTFFLFFIQI